MLQLLLYSREKQQIIRAAFFFFSASENRISGLAQR